MLWVVNLLVSQIQAGRLCSLDIWEGFFKPTRAGHPSYERCGPKGLGNLTQASAWANFPRPFGPQSKRGKGVPVLA
jgi:hypothetical protein